MSRVGKPETLKKINKTLILDILKRDGPISRAAIARKTQLSPPAVSSIIAELINENLVIQIGLGISPSGRKPILLDFNGDAGLVVAVDAAGAAITIGLLNLGGQVIARKIISAKHLGAPGVTDVQTGTVAWAPVLG